MPLQFPSTNKLTQKDWVSGGINPFFFLGQKIGPPNHPLIFNKNLLLICLLFIIFTFFFFFFLTSAFSLPLSLSFFPSLSQIKKLIWDTIEDECLNRNVSFKKMADGIKSKFKKKKKKLGESWQYEFIVACCSCFLPSIQMICCKGIYNILEVDEKTSELCFGSNVWRIC